MEAAVVAFELSIFPNSKQRLGEQSVAIAVCAGLVVLTSGNQKCRGAHPRPRTGAVLLDFVVELLVIHVNAQRDVTWHHTRTHGGHAQRGKLDGAQYCAAVATIGQHEDPDTASELLERAVQLVID